MRLKRFDFLALTLALATMFASATLVRAALSPGQNPGRAFLAGQLLIASPAMGDPRFDHTVVLMVRHNQDGAFGIVINRPIGQRSLATMLQTLGGAEHTLSGDVPVYQGGPVAPELGFVVHSADYRGIETIDIDGRVAVTSSSDILRAIGDNKGPSKRFVAFGYAGWGPNQLEGELARNAWFIAPIDPQIVFDDDRNDVWEHAMKRRTQDL